MCLRSQSNMERGTPQENYMVRLFERTLFEYCNHYIMRFDVKRCSSKEHDELFFEKITIANVDDCQGMGYCIDRMKKYLSLQSDKIWGYLYYRKIDRKPVGCIWVAFKGANEFQFRVRTVEAFGFDFAVLPKFRGKGIIGYMICNLLKEISEKEITSLYCSVRKNNISAIRAYKKIGGQIVDSKKFFRIAGVCFLYPAI